MIKAQKILQPEWYTPIADRGSEVPTRFRIRGLDGIEIQDVRVERRDGQAGMSSECARASLVAGLSGWEHFVDNDNKPVEFLPYDLGANLKRLPWEIVLELAIEIYVRSRISDAERKNSSSLLTSPQSSESPSTAASANGDGTATSETQPASSSG